MTTSLLLEQSTFKSFFKWVGTIGGIAGAFLLAANVPFSGWGYVPFLIGALALVGWGVLIGEPAIWILNLVFCVANVIGIWRWLLASSLSP